MKSKEMFWQMVEEMARVRWMLVLAVGVVLLRSLGLIPEESPLLVVLYKPSLAAIGLIAAHVGYSQLFPYLNQRDLLFRALAVFEFSALENDPEARTIAAACFVGTCILRGAMYAAFVIGVTLGL